jgi:hypothetical protein
MEEDEPELMENDSERVKIESHHCPFWQVMKGKPTVATRISCLFWKEEVFKWTRKGCVSHTVSLKTQSTQTGKQ